jgi:uncharacterized Zn finger protein
MTTATANKNEVELIATSTPNFFYAVSSNGYDVYALLITGPGAATCTCPAFEVFHKPCKHRRALLATHIYLDPEISLRLANLDYEVRELNQHLLNLIEGEAEQDEVRTLFDTAA